MMPEVLDEDQPHRRRNDLQMYAEILELARKGIMKTHLMYKVGSSFDQTNEYLSCLLEDGLLRTEKRGKSMIFVDSDKGKEFLEKSEYTLGMLKELKKYRDNFTEDARPSNEKLNSIIRELDKVSVAAPSTLIARSKQQ